jgi:hypothetical protein
MTKYHMAENVIVGDGIWSVKEHEPRVGLVPERLLELEEDFVHGAHLQGVDGLHFVIGQRNNT